MKGRERFSPGSILVVKPSSLGDVVHTLPAVHAVKRQFPGARISWVVNTEWRPLLEGNPDLSKIIDFPRGKFRGLRGIPALARWASTMKAEPVALALDFQGLTRSALLSRFFRAARVYCLGNAEWLVRATATKVIPVDPSEHAVDRYLRMAAELGADISEPQFLLPDGHPLPDPRLGAPFILLHPFSRGKGKSLPGRMVQRLCEAVQPHQVVLAGRYSGQAPTGENVINLLNRTTLPELIWLCHRAAYICSVDSGPMHIAAAITPRLLGIHTWTDPRKVGPYAQEAFVWKAGEIVQRGAVSPTLAETSKTAAEVDVEAVARHILDEMNRHHAHA